MSDATMFRFTVRKAAIDAKLREQFELFGKEVVALTLGLGQMPAGQFLATSSPQSRSTDAQITIFKNQPAAVQWLQEKRDEVERYQTVTLVLLIVTTLIAVVALVLSVVSLAR
jgi:hypothetical protein